MKFLYRVIYHREIEADSQEEADDLVSHTPLPDDYVADTQESMLLTTTEFTADIRYWDEWDEHTDIDWWNEGRRKLNNIIRIVNQWTLDGCSSSESAVVLRHIEHGLQTFATRDGGQAWAQELREMRQYVQEIAG